MRKIELLSPAKDLYCGMAAIDHGADAVYIGGPKFGARSGAANSVKDIETLIRYAHTFRARVYVTMNTLFTDRELDLAIDIAWQLYHAGADALIIQDMGLLECNLPPMALHASTQTDNRTLSKISFLEKIGFNQVVLARELSLDKIKSIRAATRISLECFVHGALCVSYSGQCYISQVMANRSANRGECAQFCRHRYTLEDSRKKVLAQDLYLISLKDLNLSDYLEDLINAGIDSFKIEGRLKDETYVKNVTAFYRKALDRIIDTRDDLIRASSGQCRFSFEPDPERSFNRGSTAYYLVNPNTRPGAVNSPKSTGQKLGPVIKVEKQYFEIDTRHTLQNGDGLCFFDGTRSLVGIRANRVEGHTIYPRPARIPPVGTLVYRNADTAFIKSVTASRLARKIRVCLHLKQTDAGLMLTVNDEDHIVSQTDICVEKGIARQPGTASAMAEKQLKKSGGTLFFVDQIRLDLDNDAFYPAAVFNELRRKALTRHQDVRLASYKPDHVEHRINDTEWPWPGVSYLDNITNDKAVAFYRRHGVSDIDRDRLNVKNISDAALMTTRYCIRAQLELCPGKTKAPERKSAPTLILQDLTGSYVLEFDCTCCEMTLRRASQRKESN